VTDSYVVKLLLLHRHSGLCVGALQLLLVLVLQLLLQFTGAPHARPGL
jgi:hypothetical protein